MILYNHLAETATQGKYITRNHAQLARLRKEVLQVSFCEKKYCLRHLGKENVLVVFFLASYADIDP